jgi:hypothetical protein
VPHIARYDRFANSRQHSQALKKPLRRVIQNSRRFANSAYESVPVSCCDQPSFNCPNEIRSAIDAGRSIRIGGEMPYVSNHPSTHSSPPRCCYRHHRAKSYISISPNAPCLSIGCELSWVQSDQLAVLVQCAAHSKTSRRRFTIIQAMQTLDGLRPCRTDTIYNRPHACMKFDVEILCG